MRLIKICDLNLGRPAAAVLAIHFAFVSSGLAQKEPFIPTEENSWVADLSGPMDSPSPIDLRGLNEELAGQSGFVRVAPGGRGFVRGDGEPIRFWGTHTGLRSEWTEDEHREYVRGLARMGVNLVMAGTIAKPAPEQDDIDVIDPQILDDLWRHIAMLKEHGIYSAVRGTWFHSGLGIDPGIEGYGAKDGLYGVIFFHPRLQAAYRSWIEAMFTRENPYTGVPLAKEPAVVSFTAFNEDTLLFYTFAQLKGEPLRLAQTAFARWAEKKYGSIDEALEAWHGARAEGDDVASGRLGFLTWWFAWGEGRRQMGRQMARLQDQLRFCAEVQRDYYADLKRWFREELGAEQLFLTSNFRSAEPAVMQDLENWVKSTGDIIAMNSYPGGNILEGPDKGWKVEEGYFFTSDSITRQPLEIPQAKRQVAGKPFWISETLWPFPHEYANEAPLLSAIYANVTGMTTAMFAGPRSPRWTGESVFFPWNRAFAQRWNCSEPGQMSPFPAAALILRGGYGLQTEPAVLEHRTYAEDLVSLEPPLVPARGDYDPNRDATGQAGEEASVGKGDGSLPQEAFLMGPVMANLLEKDAGKVAENTIAEAVRKYDGGKVIRSVDGAVRCDRETGLVTLDTPEAQVAVGHLRTAGRVDLTNISVEAQNKHLGIAVVALDEKPLADSGKILVQVSPRARPSGWQLRAATRDSQSGEPINGWEIVNIGEAPFRVENIRATLWLHNLNTQNKNNPGGRAGLTRATVLTALGREREVIQLNRAPADEENDEGGTIEMQLPKNAFYLVLE